MNKRLLILVLSALLLPVFAFAEEEDIDFSDLIEEEVDVDIDNVQEENFNKIGESFLKATYNNVLGFKTTKAETKGNQLRLEGLIKFKSGKEKKTNFIFESREATPKGKVRFVGENLQLCRGKKAFTLIGSVKNGNFISESFNYNYRAKDANGKSQRVYGTVKVEK